MNAHVIKFDPHGNGHCLYTEQIDLRALGELQIVRAATIEFNNDTAEWEVKDSENQLLFHHPFHAACLAWEQQYFNR
jgi:hypothetical protein